MGSKTVVKGERARVIINTSTNVPAFTYKVSSPIINCSFQDEYAKSVEIRQFCGPFLLKGIGTTGLVIPATIRSFNSVPT